MAIKGEEVARRRIQRDMSREELAMRVPMSVAALTDIENGVTRNPQRRTVEGLARALACTPGDLTGDPQPPTPDPTGPEEVAILEIYRRLTFDYRDSALRVMRGLLREQQDSTDGQL